LFHPTHSGQLTSPFLDLLTQGREGKPSPSYTFLFSRQIPRFVPSKEKTLSPSQWQALFPITCLQEFVVVILFATIADFRLPFDAAFQ